MVKRGITASLTPIVYTGWRPGPEVFETMDRGVSNCADYMEYLAKQIAEFRKANPQNETGGAAMRSFMEGQPRPPQMGGRRGMPPAALSQAAGRPGIKTFQAQYKRAHELGLPFSLGLDAQYGGIPWSMEFLVEAGIPPMDAIRAGTAVAAKLIGYGDRLGTIEPGKLADLIGVEGNPAEDITRMRRLRFVMKDGDRYDATAWR
jgi:imidazolonepropionase-like amidohydrolase